MASVPILSPARGKEVELKAKPLEIREIEILSFEAPVLTLRILCSKGTYIRALARDLGQALETGAHLTALRRTRVGDVTIDRCWTLDEALEHIANDELTFPEEE